LQVAQALLAEGAVTQLLHHGLGRLAVLRLRRALYRLRPDLIVVTGASSTRDVRRVATMVGCPLVCYSWPDGPVYNVHDKRDRAHASTELVRQAGTAPPKPRALPTRVVVASAAQRQQVQSYFAHGESVLAPERVHVLPLLPEPPPLSRGGALTPPTVANAAALAEHTAFLWEVLTERPHRSLGHGLLRGVVAKAVKLGPRPTAIALAYHQVRREVRGFDLSLVIAEGTLERQVRALLRRGYRAVTVAEQAELLLAKRTAVALAPGPTFSISFDDGYVDTLTIAAPLLRSLGVPFTVYVITDIVTGARALPWYDLVAQSLLAPDLRPRALRVMASEPTLRPLLTAAQPPPLLAQAALAGCKALPGAQHEALIAALWAEVGPSVQALPATPRYLDADGVRGLREFAAEVSSHSRSHPILTQLTDEALQSELQGSRAQLCELVGSCPGLAYPNGDSDERVRAAAAAAGYQYAVAVTPQAGPPTRYRLGRRMLSELSGLGLDGRFSEDVLWARIRGALG
jgi:peptidoglycan/xylan/chitin deacetylase (PgdA/CDA1 family)